MHKHTAKRHYPGGNSAISEYFSGLTQTRLFRNKLVEKILGAEQPQPAPARRQLHEYEQCPPVAGELPDETGNTSLDVDSIKKGGLLQIITRNTIYNFQMLSSRDAVLSTNQQNRPAGLVQLRGCTFGCSGSISPDRLFCGGNLEFSSNATRQVHITSEIQSLKWQPAV